jgi:2-keto-4-pentenoate hydratase/2-oxohepta-3-ene-1,7-dioic acid hydratase in catechol pathway
MKLARFTAGGAPELGVVDGTGIVSLSRVIAGLDDDMIALITRWDDLKGEVARIAATGDRLDLNAVRLLAPIKRPGKIMAIGLNYADHVAESKMETPANQIWFAKMATAANGPFDPIQVPKVSQALDYEAEMVAVIGKGGRHIGVGDAPARVFGWCVGNDATERAWQHRTHQWTLGKSFDTHAPFGPWITTADEIADPHALDITCHVNGEQRQSSNTRHLIFKVWDQIAHLSGAMTLEPGDLIYTGTPGGIGAAMDPRQFLKDGDVVRIEIEGLGAIENPCVNEA